MLDTHATFSPSLADDLQRQEPPSVAVFVLRFGGIRSALGQVIDENLQWQRYHQRKDYDDDNMYPPEAAVMPLDLLTESAFLFGLIMIECAVLFRCVVVVHDSCCGIYDDIGVACAIKSDSGTHKQETTYVSRTHLVESLMLRNEQ